jgi:enterochelin esterase family protein
MTREEAAPTFETWRRRLEAAPQRDGEEVTRFLEVLRTIGTPMIDGPAVSFVYHDPHARRVAVAGEFNQWDRTGQIAPMEQIDDSGIFHYTLNLSEPARLEYKYIVDGEWKPDPLCHNFVDNGVGGQNSYFVVGEFHEPPELEWVEGIPHGRVEEFEFESQRLRNRRAVHVYLPPGYDESAAPMPVLYVHDGGEYLSRARLPVVLDNLVNRGEVASLIAVMVDPVNRMAEYRMNDAYADFVASELLPHIDSRFRTLASSAGRGVMGASLGGLISVYLALTRPDLFSRTASQSGAFLLAEEPILTLARNAQPTQSFYFDVGKYEQRFIPAHLRLVGELKARGCRCFFQELAGGHNWTSWRAHLRDLLTFLWPREPGKPTGRKTRQRRKKR